ncbi:hypothetical protein ACXR0O_08590 [Verrucomicrobiota bacterium sgz303538]
MTPTEVSAAILEPTKRDVGQTSDAPNPVFDRKLLLTIVLTLLAATFPLWPGLEMSGLGMDEGTLLVYPELVTKGKLPYRDFETFYGPANIYVLAGVYSVFGTGVGVERGVGFFYRVLILAGVFVFARRWGTAMAVGSTMIGGFIFLGSRLVAFAWLGGVACLIWSVLCLSGGGRPWRVILGGGLAGAALLFRPDLGPAAILSALPMFFALTRRQRWLYVGGGALGLLPMFILLLVTGWRALWENLFLYPVVICNPGRRIPLASTPDDFLFLFFFHLGAAICAILAGAVACLRDRHSQQAKLFLSFALLAVGLTHQTMQRIDILHVAMTIFLTLAMLPLTLVLLMRRGRVEAPPLRWLIGATALVIAFVAVGAPRVGGMLLYNYGAAINPNTGISPQVVAGDRRFPTLILPDETQKVVSGLERTAKPGERLFVGMGDLRLAYVNDTYIYHLLPWMEPASYFLEMNPFSANRPGSRLAADIASADWLVLNRLWDKPHEPNLANQPGTDAPVEVVRTQFDLVARSGPYLVFHRKVAAK